MTSSIDELIENASDAQLRRLLAEGARLSGNPVAACIVGYAVIDDRREVDETAVWERLSEKLPPGMLPNGIRVVSSLPRGRSGKVDEDTLRLRGRRLGEGSTSASLASAESALHRTIAGVWKAMLGQECAPETDFFQSGGTSVLAMRMSAAVAEATGVAIGVVEAFRYRRLSAYTRRVSELAGVQR
jgi:non-ribosomal peptide synthetase